MKKISLLGASGSIGQQTVEVRLANPDLLQIKAISVGQNIDACRKILNRVNEIELVSLSCEKDAQLIAKEYPHLDVVYGEDGLVRVAQYEESTYVVNALVGFVGLVPIMKAIEAKKHIALANKESLVAAGELVTKLAQENQVKIIPVDSEHSAIFQALQGECRKDVSKIIITASGGSFRNLTREQLKDVTLEDALNHPNWKMGAKITIDSATMMNKGFEVIEAHWLFDVSYDDIEVVLHPQSVIHSMVEFQDNAIIAQLGSPSMLQPIQYALTYPRRAELHNEKISWQKFSQLTFAPMDYERYPLLSLAFEVGRKKGNLAAVMNGANDVANELFRSHKISFLQLEEIVIEAVHACKFEEIHCLEDCLRANQFGRDYVLERLG